MHHNQRMFWLSVLGFSSIIYMVVALSKFRPNNVPIFPPPEAEETSVCSTSTSTTTADTSPSIFFITPTYPRREQVAELTRLGQTLLLAGNVHWVVAEDSGTCSPLVAALLSRMGLPYTHIISPQPNIYKEAKLKYNPRGVSSRRAGLSWVMEHQPEGVIYFGDDDNTYDIRLFKEIATTQKVSMFPVGFIGIQGVSSPIVVDGKVVGFSDDWFAQRKFPVDMAGFAVNLEFLRSRNKKANRAMPYKAGYEEDVFLQNLNLTLDDIEPLASDCTEVLVWHTKTVKEKKSSLKPLDEARASKSNLGQLLEQVSFTGLGEVVRGGRKVKTCYDMKKCKTSG